MLKVCSHCNQEFNASEKKRKFCSKICFSDSRIGFKHTEEAKQKNRKAHLGKKDSPATIALKIKKLKGHKVSVETRKKLSAIHSGKSYHLMTPEIKYKISQALTGRKNPIHPNTLAYARSPEHAKKMRELHGGEKNVNWKGGVTPIYHKIRNSSEYKSWREAVFKRDNYSCLHCGDNRGGNLNADHILPFAYFTQFRFDVKNGRTLCIPCHRLTDTFGKRFSEDGLITLMRNRGIPVPLKADGTLDWDKVKVDKQLV